uniref:Ecdysteroid kinase n=1 Tax=Musca domestica TaxID=7370 RepID=T1PAV2_MUSDO
MGAKNNNKDDTSSIVPKWIEARLFEGALKEVESEFKEIVDFKAKGALAPGENYCTIMLKADFIIKLKDESTKPLSFMLKVGHDTDLFREMMEGHNIFGAETGMYREVVPELEKIYSDAGVNVKFGAKSYTLATDQSYILLENLKEKGFRNANRLDGLDMEHTKCVLEKMAQWHAASAVRAASKGMYSDLYSEGYIRPKSFDLIKGMYESSEKIFLECVKEYSNSDLYYGKVVEMYQKVAVEMFKTADTKHDSEFSVLNHGDAWVNNIMFCHDEETGKILETYFVDYQIPRYASPAQDLWYFILSSAQYEIKLQQFDFLVAFYHQHLEKNLKLLKYPNKIPSLKDLHLMLYKDGIWAFRTVTGVMSAVLCDPNENASLDNFMGESDAGAAFKRQMYSNPRYRKHMEAILPWLLYRGLLDY